MYENIQQLPQCACEMLYVGEPVHNGMFLSCRGAFGIQCRCKAATLQLLCAEVPVYESWDEVS